jgi:hypothetical protein
MTNLRVAIATPGDSETELVLATIDDPVILRNALGAVIRETGERERAATADEVREALRCKRSFFERALERAAGGAA